ncbi:MAG: alpha-amylase family glycosyl hydrolase [Myxococcaceae bacterium]|nr:alpha-amylase family glycosyl hydrolase [Myxococcaceae bacterium]
MNARLALSVLGLLALSCIPKVPRQRLENATPIVVGYIVDPTYAGEPSTAPDKLKEALARTLEERNLSVVEVPLEVLKGQRITDTRRAALEAQQPDAPYFLLVELRVHFFSQLDGRYRWEVGTALTAVKNGGVTSKDAFEVPVVLVYDHEKQRAAMNAASQDIATRLASLMDGLLVSAEKPATQGTPDPAAPASFQQPLMPGQLVPTKSKPKEAPKEAPQDAPRESPKEAPKEAPPAPTGRRATPRSIYFVMVDRFANGSRANDGDADPADPQAFHGGDLAGLRGRLDWLQALGIDTVWLSPVFRMRTQKWHGYGAFHGYWTYELNEVEPRLGTEAELVALSDDLHRRGMKLVLDLVLNHVGPEAPVLRERPEWFHHNGGVTDWNDAVQLTTHDVHGLPDLATERPDVARHLVDASRRWLRSCPA